ncbi:MULTISPECIES: ATP-binding protein [unclassified Colwellia]|uniref:ATP-binding protein n=1 Tax=unclassified Colwellia TaxID=196834 RepID=UPI0015F3890D|nr:MULTISPECIES: ATP-binding protein [unclassified Colwellia]MBA6354417.1 response regulator [Colwellia sp. BRX8-3]MBA6358316.1 response regulator [Colwellia sp. BRX8-6]MBA6365931.1 response regulator [Colwellia sp. BRX8-5]MBA6370309.1 response regulator [Colwellia sp. BRX8-4]MBA6375899.1 response regulator [Colwellia sp. BRX8-2]
MFRSLKTQLMLSLALIILLFIGQETVSYQNQKRLVTGLASNQEIVDGVVQVKALEKDVLDLQRNVLIYKENQASSVLKRLNDMMSSVTGKLAITSLFIEKNNIGTDQQVAIESMRDHLKAYRENFDSVVLLIDKKSELFNKTIVTHLSHLNTITDEVSNGIHLNQSIQTTHVTTKKLADLTSALQLSAYQYFIRPNTENITNFQSIFSQVESTAAPLNIDGFTSTLTALSSDFNLLTQVTRNYNYLVNVVMSGSANEFLYLAKNLSEVALTHLDSSNAQLNTLVEESVIRGNIMFILGIFLTSLITVYILKRLIFPIEKVTQVFNALAENKIINEKLELNVNRKDEIGHLMKSATIFQLKNKQTNDLLLQSQQLNQQLVLSQKRAEQATKAKSMFLANMSHEIRTPMNGVVGMLSLLSNTPLNDEQKEYINLVNSSSESLLTLINSILDYSKIESGKLAIESIHFNVTDIINEVVIIMNALAEKKSLVLNIRSMSLSQKTVIGDPTRLKQILINLLSNAIKFTEQGTIDLEVELTEINKEQLNFSCKVSDTGIGLSEEQQQNIFTPFSQADNSTTRKYGGTGLGLTIVKQLCELMSGDIDIKSTLNKGSCFSFYLVYQKPENDITDSAEPDIAINPVNLSFKKILLVEDNRINQIVATKILTKLTLSADIAVNGIHALEKLNSSSYDLILMDCQMPEMDGYQTTKAIRAGEAGKAHQDIAIIAMTANAMKGDKERCLSAGMNDYLAKPIDINKLHQKLTFWMNKNNKTS